jgi:integrase
LWSRATSDKLHQIKIRITEKRKSTYVDIGLKVKKNEWNERTKRVKASHSDFEYINSVIDKYLSMYLGGKKTSESSSKYGYGTLEKLFQMRIDDFQSQSRMAAVRRYTTLLGHLRNLNIHSVKLNELNIGHRQMMDNYFINEIQIANSTRHTYHKVMRTSLKFAEGYPNLFTLPDINLYNNHKVQYKPSTKVSLKSIEVHQLFSSIDYEILTKQERFATQLFLFSFSAMGMRFKDVIKLKWTDIEEGCINYVMSKNQRNMKVKLNENIINILKWFLPPNLYLNPFVQRSEQPKFIDTRSNKIYRLEEEYYDLKMQQTSLMIMSNISRFKPEVNESPKVSKLLKTRDLILQELIMEYSSKLNGFIFVPSFNEKINIVQLYNQSGSLNARINKVLKEVSNKLQIRKFSFHSARHTFAYLSRKNRVDLYLISKCLGHSSLAITEQYLREFEDQEVYEANDKMVDVISQFYN